MKNCTKCGESKPLDMFYARKGSSDGRMSHCKPCKNASTYSWRDANREHLNAYQREFNGTEEQRQKRSAYAKRPDVFERANDLARKRRAEDSSLRLRIAERERSDKVVAYRKAYKARPERKERERELRQRDHIKSRHRQRAREERATAKGSLNNRMSCGIRQAILKNRRSWISLVGYSLADLMDHLEKQFLPGMGWHNFGEWHVDHIVPIKDFTYSSPDDLEFKACWSLGNLRPLWGPDNIKKSDQRIFLL